MVCQTKDCNTQWGVVHFCGKAAGSTVPARAATCGRVGTLREKRAGTEGRDEDRRTAPRDYSTFPGKLLEQEKGGPSSGGYL